MRTLSGILALFPIANIFSGKPPMPRLKMVRLAAALVCVALLAPAIARAADPAPIHRMYVFGDSYSDIGEGYLDGNGPTAVAYLAERLGFAVFPSDAINVTNQSLDFAISGAQTGSGLGRKVDNALLG